MARPRKTGLDYFPHDCTASHDSKLEAMELEHGLAGYAFYFKILERVYAENGLNLRRPASYGACVKQMSLGKEQFDAMLETAFECELFERETYDNTGDITSESIRKRIESVNIRRVSATETPQKPDNNESICGVSVEFPSREKKSKEKKSKEKNHVVVVANPVAKPARAREDDGADEAYDDYDGTVVSFQVAMTEIEKAAEGIGLPLESRDEQTVNLLVADYGGEWVLLAIERMADRPKDKRSWGYAKSILKRWRDNGGPDDASPPGQPRASPSGPKRGIDQSIEFAKKIARGGKQDDA